MINTHINGIPCKAEMTSGYYEKPDYNTWDSDADYYGGWFDVEFKVYDRKGYLANWLERKMTAKDEERIIQQLIEDVEH